MQESILTTGEAELHWVKLGVAVGQEEGASLPTLVFLHYFGGSVSTWGSVMTLLEDAFPCVALDMRGFGASKAKRDPGENASYSVGRMAGDVCALIAHLKLRNYILVAHSMSGKVALHLASDDSRPTGLAGLILVGPSPLTPEPMTEKDRARMLAGWGSEKEARGTLKKITAQLLPENLATVAVDDMLRTSASAWRAWLELGSRESFPERMRRISRPVTLIAGEKDPVITPALVQSEVADRLQEKFSPLTVVQGAGHLMPLEAPEVLAGLIRQAAGGEI